MFNVGDKVRRKIGTGDCSTAIEGKTYTVFQHNNGYLAIGENMSSTAVWACNCYYNWELISSPEQNKGKGIIKMLNQMMKKLLDKDTKTLIKADYMNGDLLLTTKGKESLEAILFEANKIELVKQAEETIVEEKENK